MSNVTGDFRRQLAPVGADPRQLATVDEGADNREERAERLRLLQTLAWSLSSFNPGTEQPTHIARRHPPEAHWRGRFHCSICNGEWQGIAYIIAGEMAVCWRCCVGMTAGALAEAPRPRHQSAIALQL